MGTRLDPNILVQGLMADQRVLTDSNAKLSAAVAKLVHENERLVEKNKELAQHIKELREVPTQFASGPLFVSEEEEDARYAFEHGDIDREMFEKTLADLGLDPNISIEVS